MDDKTLQTLSGPTFLSDLCEHVTSGGSLPNLCKLLSVRYSKVIEWIYTDPIRSEQYERALKARGEWAVQSVLSELKDIALADIRQAYDEQGNMLPPNEWPDALARTIAAVETNEIAGEAGYTKRIKMWDKLKALELLGKNLKLFKEQIEHSGQLTLEDLVTGSMEPPKEITHEPEAGKETPQGS